RIGIVSLSERYTSPRRCIDTVSPMEAKANGRALEEFIKRRIETGAQVHSLRPADATPCMSAGGGELDRSLAPR
ncbi:MAG TPA: hypothetical protein VIM30_04920, partial [Candidatus Limnocylindrales bacterium]